MEIKEILENLGYGPITESGEYLRMKPLYRDSDNNSVLSVNRKTGYWKDFKLSESGSLGNLIQKTLGLESIVDAYQFLEKEFQFSPKSIIHTPKIKLVKKFSEDFVKELEKNYSYWGGRGISQETLDQFEGGIHVKTKRYYFVIRDENKNIIGLTGRTLVNSKVKWLIRGSKKLFNYNLNLNSQIIKEKREVVLVESIGNFLSLWECGIKTGITCFGTSLSNEMVTTLIKLDPKKIIILFDSDGDRGAGEIGSSKVQNRLLRYFDARQVKTVKCPEKDVNEMLLKQGKDKLLDWYLKI